MRKVDIAKMVLDKMYETKFKRLGRNFKFVFLPKRFIYNYAVNKLGFLPRKHPRRDGKIVYKSGKTMKAVLNCAIIFKKWKIIYKANVPNYIKYTVFRTREKDDIVDLIFETIINIPATFGKFYRLVRKLFPEYDLSIRKARTLYSILRKKKKVYYYYRPWSIYSELKRVKQFEIDYLWFYADKLQYAKSKVK